MSTLQVPARSMEVLVEVERSGFVESRHYGCVAVCDPDGRLVASAGDAELTLFARSTTKPLQAVAVHGLGVQEGLGLTDVALAGACGSHDGEPVHVDNVRTVLAAAGLDESALRCPPALPGNDEARLHAAGRASVYHNCSGKHAYMLAGTALHGWEPARYTAPDHPLQVRVTETVGAYSGTPVRYVGVDGCGVPVHALPLRGLATAYARLGSRALAGEPAAAAVLAAVRHHPVMIAGSRRLDTAVLELGGGEVLTKVGAEAVYAATNPAAGLGLALKVVDGGSRAAGAAVLAVLRALGWLDDEVLATLWPYGELPLRGGGAVVGAIRPATVRLRSA